MTRMRLRFVAVMLGLVACGPATDAPTAVVATPGPGLVTVSWQDSSRDEEGFVVYRKTALSEAALGAQPFEKLAQTPPDVTSYQDKDVDPQRFYRYQVTTLRQGRESAATPSEGAVQPRPPQITLTVNLVGTGTVTSEPPGVTCEAKLCTGTFDKGTRVKLTAAPGANSGFVAWGGACSSAACEVVMDTAKKVEARFERTQFVLKVTRAGAAPGKVVSTPAGIDCGKDCEEVYPKGRNVSVRASPDEGALFAGWGDDCSATGTATVCTLALTKDRNVTADFTYPPPAIESFTVTPKTLLAGQSARLEWSVTARGKLKLTVSPDDDVTGKTSTIVRPSATTTYTLTAESEFGRTEAKTTLTVSPSATLTVVVNGGGIVQSTAPLNVIDCSESGGDCAEVFALDAIVTLEAFNGTIQSWPGCDQRQGNTCTLKMTGDKVVTANF